MTTLRGSWYDYPHYYDLAFRADAGGGEVH